MDNCQLYIWANLTNFQIYGNLEIYLRKSYILTKAKTQMVAHVNWPISHIKPVVLMIIFDWDLFYHLILMSQLCFSHLINCVTKFIVHTIRYVLYKIYGSSTTSIKWNNTIIEKRRKDTQVLIQLIKPFVFDPLENIHGKVLPKHRASYFLF